MVALTKTDFIQFLNCPKSLWLMLNKPSDYPFGEFSAFQQKLAAEGYEVEAYVRQLIRERECVLASLNGEMTAFGTFCR